jgi:hypothetical protein
MHTVETRQAIICPHPDVILLSLRDRIHRDLGQSLVEPPGLVDILRESNPRVEGKCGFRKSAIEQHEEECNFKNPTQWTRLHTRKPATLAHIGLIPRLLNKIDPGRGSFLKAATNYTNLYILRLVKLVKFVAALFFGTHNLENPLTNAED